MEGEGGKNFLRKEKGKTGQGGTNVDLQPFPCLLCHDADSMAQGCMLIYDQGRTLGALPISHLHFSIVHMDIMRILSRSKDLTDRFPVEF